MATKTVTLVAPDGGEVNVSHPADVNSLVFGQGYKPKGNQTVDQALAALAGSDVVKEAAAEQAMATQTVTTQVKPGK